MQDIHIFLSIFHPQFIELMDGDCGLNKNDHQRLIYLNA